MTGIDPWLESLTRYAGDDSKVWREHPRHLLDWLLSDFRWWRRRRGGHWEHWFIGVFTPTMGEQWFHPVQCSRRKSDGRVPREPGLGWMVTRCEDYS